MENEYSPWAMFHSTDLGDNLEEMVETEDCKEIGRASCRERV